MPPIPKFSWLPVNTLYGAATSVRRRLYESGVLQVHRLEVPVISVGNISAGGTGKTPLVIWLAGALADRGYRVCVVTRGYGRANMDRRVLVSDGETVSAEIDQAGDEPFLVAESLLGRAAVVCDRDRVAGAQWAVENLDADLIILDDAFQHFRLGRTVNLVTLDATRQFSGLMREGPRALRRADAVLVSRSDLTEDPDAVRTSVERASGGRPVYTSRLRTIATRPLNSASSVSSIAPGERVGAFCGVGNPEAFFTQIKREQLDLVYQRSFRDHAKYSQTEVDDLCRTGASAGAQALVTTSKDAVKLRNFAWKLPCFVLDTALVIDDADGFLALIEAKLPSP